MTYWRLYANEGEKFNYILQIQKDQEILLSLLVRDTWPGQKGNIFCLRTENQEVEGLELLEEVIVKNFSTYGAKVYITLDRSQKKRCSFLIIKKSYKNKPGEYEQIFWQTQEGVTQRKPKASLALYKRYDYTVIQDTREKYPWRFQNTIKRALPVGDYAIEDEHGYLSIIERKTRSNFLHDLGNVTKLHQQLHELESYPNPILIVEGYYSDFLKQKRIGNWSPSFVQKCIAEIYALHAKLQIVFLANRKVATSWAQSYFAAVISKSKKDAPLAVHEAEVLYGASNKRGVTETIRAKIRRDFPESFTIKTIRSIFPEAQDKDIRKALNTLKQEERIYFSKGSWRKVEGL